MEGLLSGATNLPLVTMFMQMSVSCMTRISIGHASVCMV